jgi:hypothetical protein
LIAAESCKEGLFPDAGPDAFCDCLEEEIADRVSEGFIYGFEAVDIDDEHGEGFADDLVLYERGEEFLLEHGSVWETGEDIEPNFAQEQLFDPDPIGYIVGDSYDREDRAIGLFKFGFEACPVESTAERELAFRRFTFGCPLTDVDEGVSSITVAGKVDDILADEVDIAIAAGEEARSKNRSVDEVRIRDPHERGNARDETIEPGIELAEMRSHDVVLSIV